VCEAIPQVWETIPQVCEAIPQMCETIPQMCEAIPQVKEKKGTTENYRYPVGNTVELMVSFKDY